MTSSGRNLIANALANHWAAIFQFQHVSTTNDWHIAMLGLGTSNAEFTEFTEFTSVSVEPAGRVDNSDVRIACQRLPAGWISRHSCESWPSWPSLQSGCQKKNQLKHMLTWLNTIVTIQWYNVHAHNVHVCFGIQFFDKWCPVHVDAMAIQLWKIAYFL